LFIRSSQERDENNSEDPNDISNHNQILLTHWLQRQLSSQRINLTEQSIHSPSDIVVDIDEGVGIERTSNRPLRYEAAQSPTNNSNNPLVMVNEFLEQNPEVYSLFQSFLGYLPFAILVLLKEFYEHTTGNNLIY